MESISGDGIYKIKQLIGGKKFEKYYQFDAFENKTKVLGTFPQGLSLIFHKESDHGYQLYFKKEEDMNKNKMELFIYSSIDKKIEKFYSGSNMSVFENVGNWVFASKYTERKSKYINNAGEYPPIMELYAINIKTGKQTLLCDQFNDSYQNFLTDGNYIAWTKLCYEVDDQWKNVCFTKLP